MLRQRGEKSVHRGGRITSSPRFEESMTDGAASLATGREVDASPGGYIDMLAGSLCKNPAYEPRSVKYPYFQRLPGWMVVASRRTSETLRNVW